MTGSGRLFGIIVLLLGLGVICYSNRVKGGITEKQYVYKTENDNNCTVTVIEDHNDVKILPSRSCVKKITKGTKDGKSKIKKKKKDVEEEGGKAKPLKTARSQRSLGLHLSFSASMNASSEKVRLLESEIEYFKQHAAEWKIKIPAIKRFISGFKTVKGGITEKQYVYTTENDNNCTVTVIEDHNDVKISPSRSCFRKLPEGTKDGKSKKKNEGGESKPLSELDIKYFNQHAEEWKIPTIKTLIEGHKKVRGGTTETRYVYITDNDNNCTVTVMEDDNDIRIKCNRACVKKVTKGKREMKSKKKAKEEKVGDSKPLSESDIEYFNQHAVEWKIPRIKTLINGYKKVKGRTTETQYVYITDTDNNCIVTVMEDDNDIRIKRNRACVKNVTKGTKGGKSKKVDEKRGESNPLSESDVKYFNQNAEEWKVPTIKTLIKEHKKVKGGTTETQFVYISDNGNNCTVTVMEDDNDIRIKSNMACVKNVTKGTKDGKSKKKKKQKDKEEGDEEMGKWRRVDGEQEEEEVDKGENGEKEKEEKEEEEEVVWKWQRVDEEEDDEVGKWRRVDGEEEEEVDKGGIGDKEKEENEEGDDEVGKWHSMDGEEEEDEEEEEDKGENGEKAIEEKGEKEDEVEEEAEGLLNQLSEFDIEYFKQHAKEWGFPPIKGVINGRKKLADGSTDTQYVYTSDIGQNCTVTITEDSEGGVINRMHSCVAKEKNQSRKQKQKKKKKKQKDKLSELDIEYFEKHAREFDFPPIKKFIDGHKNVSEGKTKTQYEYITDDGTKCTATIMKDNKGDVIMQKYSCVSDDEKKIENKPVKNKEETKEKKKDEDEEEEGKSMPLSSEEIKDLEEHAKEWNIPEYKAFIDGHKTVRGGETARQYVYASIGKNCTLNVVEDNNSKSIKLDWLCVKNAHKQTKKGKSKKKKTVMMMTIEEEVE